MNSATVAKTIDGIDTELKHAEIGRDVRAMDIILDNVVAADLRPVAPEFGATNVSLTPNLSWEDDLDRGSYTVVVSYNSDLSNPVVNTVVEVKNYTVPSPLNVTTKFYWKVVANETVDLPAIVAQVGVDDSLQGDRDSLKLHYDALNGANWDNAWDTSVIENGDLGTLYGVTTDDNGRVTEIDVISNGLVGQLPEWPGLQEMWKYYVKQNIPELGGNQPERITGPIPKSLGGVSKKVTHLSLAGSRMSSEPEDVMRRPDEDDLGYNMKSGVGANQFSGGIPEELKQTRLKIFEIDGQWSQLNAVWDPEWGTAWDIERIFFAGAAHHSGQSDLYPNDNGFSLSGFISNTKHWVDCEYFVFINQDITGVAVDAFEGWNPIRGRFIGFNPEQPEQGWSQPFPDMSSLTSTQVIKTTNINFTGPYPAYFHNGDFTRLQELFFRGTDIEMPDPNLFPDMSQLPDLRRFSFQGNSSSQKQPFTGKLFADGEYVGGYFENRMINFNTRYTSMNVSVPDGAHEWYRLRYWYDNQGESAGYVSNRPPGEYSPSLRRLYFFENNYNQRVPEWGKAGSLVKYGKVWESGDVDAHGVEDAGQDLYYMEDLSADFNRDRTVSGSLVISGYAPETPTDSGRKIRITTGGSTQMFTIVSNTVDRIIFKSDDPPNIDGSSTYEVVQNGEDDNRAFSSGISWRDNFMYGLIRNGCAPEHLVGGNFDISDNLLTYKDIRPSLAYIESVEANSPSVAQQYWPSEFESGEATGFEYKYWPQKRFGQGIPNIAPVQDIQVIVGQSFEIDFSDYVSDQHNVYAWYKNGALISGETSNKLTVASAQQSDFADYELVVTNPQVPKLTEIRSQIINVEEDI